MDNIDIFIDKLLDEKKIPREPIDVHKQLHDDLKQRLLDQIDAAVINRLTEEQADTLDKILDNPEATDKNIQDFFAKTNIDRGKVALETMLKFKVLYLGSGR
jgi:hypothetical protein